MKDFCKSFKKQMDIQFEVQRQSKPFSNRNSVESSELFSNDRSSSFILERSSSQNVSKPRLPLAGPCDLLESPKFIFYSKVLKQVINVNDSEEMKKQMTEFCGKNSSNPLVAYNPEYKSKDFYKRSKERFTKTMLRNNECNVL